jgi:hypothetical protein
MKNIPTEKLTKIAELARQLKAAETDIASLEAELKKAQEYHHKLSFVELPEFMSEIGIRQFTLSDGTQLEVTPIFVVTLPKENIDTAEEWLEKHGHGGMVKTHVDVTMPRGQKTKLLEVMDKLNQLKVEYEVKKGIHYQTLNKWGRECEEENIVIPDDIFNIFRGNKTVIK